jgi:GPH family glycoside/pentoside/hexuronide:cation symporter
VREPIPSRRRLGYALGNAGFNLVDQLVVAVAVYFYLPPPGRGLEPQVPEGVFFGVFTVFGLAMLVGRVVDALADPFVGAASDRSRSPLGRRRVFMIAGVGPMVALPALLFFPPDAPGGPWNGVWLAVLLALYFIFFTVYVAPYLALIPELAWNTAERLRLSRLIALLGFPSMVFGMLWPLGLDLGREAGLDASTAMRLLAVATALVGLPLCLGPILAVDERRFARVTPSDLSMPRALAATLQNRPFLVYLAAQLLFILAVNLIRPVGPYLATVVLGRSEGFAALLGVGIFIGIAVGFGAMGPVVERFGPKRGMIGCVSIFGAAMALLGLLRPDVPGGPHDAANLVIGSVAIAGLGLAIAGLLVLPHVLISELVDYDERRTGAHRAAMYFGVQGLFTKWMYGVGLWVFTFLLSRFGNSPEQPLGVLLVGPVAALACLASVVIWIFYPERRILEAARDGSDTEADPGVGPRAEETS